MPAKKQNRKIGSVPAAASKATKIGWFVRLVISQAAPAVCIQPPMFDRILAVQIPRKTRLARGAKDEGARAATGGDAVTPMPFRRCGGSCSERRRPNG